MGLHYPSRNTQESNCGHQTCHETEQDASAGSRRTSPTAGPTFRRAPFAHSGFRGLGFGV